VAWAGSKTHDVVEEDVEDEEDGVGAMEEVGDGESRTAGNKGEEEREVEVDDGNEES